MWCPSNRRAAPKCGQLSGEPAGRAVNGFTCGQPNKGKRRLLSVRRGADDPLSARGRVGGEEGGRLFLKGEEEEVMGCVRYSPFSVTAPHCK